MMKRTQLTKAIEETIKLKGQAVDIMIDKVIEPLTDVGSPEALIAKPYDQWTPADLMALSRIYGSGEDTVLANLIFRKEYKRVRALEQQIGE